MPNQTIPGNLEYEYGKSNSVSREFFGGLPLDAGQVNPDFVTFFDDFTVLAGKALNSTDMYDVVKDASATVAAPDVLNGVARITSANTTDNDGGLIQMTNGCFALTSGKRLWFEAMVKVSDIDHDMFIGLAEQAATDPEAVIAATIHRVGIEVTEANGAGLRFANGNGTTVDYTSLGVDMVAATYIKVGFYFNGVTLDVFVNRIKKASGIVPRPASGTDLMGLAFFNLSGSATLQHVADLDYWMVISER